MKHLEEDAEGLTEAERALAGQRVREDRELHGLTQNQVEGVSSAWLRRIEKGQIENPQKAKIAALERALKWRSGSYGHAARGGEPVRDLARSDTHRAAYLGLDHTVTLPNGEEHLTPPSLRVAATALRLAAEFQTIAYGLATLVHEIPPDAVAGRSAFGPLRAIEELQESTDEFSAELMKIRDALEDMGFARVRPTDRGLPSD